MRRTTMAVAAAACSGLLGLGLFAAPAASAYPPGKEQKTKSSKSEVRPGGNAKFEVRNAQPGCKAEFIILNSKGKEKGTRTTRVDDNRRAARTMRFPEKRGEYTVITRVYGKGCEETESSTTVRVD